MGGSAVPAKSKEFKDLTKEEIIKKAKQICQAVQSGDEIIERIKRELNYQGSLDVGFSPDGKTVRLDFHSRGFWLEIPTKIDHLASEESYFSKPEE